MNNAIMYDYYSYGDSESEKDETQDKQEEEDPNSQEAKLKKMMKEHGITIEEEDQDAEGGTPAGSAQRGSKESKGTEGASALKVELLDRADSKGSSRSKSGRKNGGSTESAGSGTGDKMVSKKSKRAKDSRQGSVVSSTKKREGKHDFDNLELPQTYHTLTMRQMGLKDEKKLKWLHDAFEKMCLKIKNKKAAENEEGYEASPSKVTGEVLWKIPSKVIAFIQNRIFYLEEHPSLVEKYELMPWHQLKDCIFDIYDHRIRHAPELNGSVNTNYCTLSEHLLMFYVDKYRRREKAEQKVADLIINLRYYYTHWKRAQIYAANCEFVFRPPSNLIASHSDREDEGEEEASPGLGPSTKVNEYGDPKRFEPPHSYVKDYQLVENDIFCQEFFLHAFSLLSQMGRKDFLESREGKTYIRTKH